MKDAAGAHRGQLAAQLQTGPVGQAGALAATVRRREGVLVLPGQRGLGHVQNAIAAGAADAQQPQVFGQQGLQETHAPRGVGQNVKKFHADAVFIIQDPEALGTAGGDLQRPDGNIRFGLNAVAPLGLIQIVPEKPLAHGGGKAGKALDGEVQGDLQKLGLHRLLHDRRQPEYGHLAVLHGQGIDLRRIVQPEPEGGGPCIEAAQTLRAEPVQGLLQRAAQPEQQVDSGGKIPAELDHLVSGQRQMGVQPIEILPQKGLVLLFKAVDP